MFGELFLGENTNYYFTATGRIEYWDKSSSAEAHPPETTGLISLTQNEVFNLTLNLKLVKVYV